MKRFLLVALLGCTSKIDVKVIDNLQSICYNNILLSKKISQLEFELAEVRLKRNSLVILRNEIDQIDLTIQNESPLLKSIEVKCDAARSTAEANAAKAELDRLRQQKIEMEARIQAAKDAAKL